MYMNLVEAAGVGLLDRFENKQLIENKGRSTFSKRTF
jgi:hypothetical protein